MEAYLLDDGRAVTIRPIRPDDDARLRESHERLSPETRYRRFLASKPRLSDADARYLVDIDGDDHCALVAILPCEDGEQIVGVSRYIRIPGDPAAAEYAVVVRDSFQGHGLGGELLRRLAAVAVDHGIVRFRATMFADNAAINRISASVAAGPVARRRLGGSLVETEFSLPGAPAVARGEAPDAADADEPPALIAA